MQIFPARRSELIGALAFAVLVLAAFSQFLFSRRFIGEPWQVAVTFGLGTAYVALGVLSHDLEDGRPTAAKIAYYLTQCLIAGAAILLSPVRGVFFLLAMPLLSQSVVEWGWRGATLVTSWLFAATVASVWIPHGWELALQMAVTYFPAFLFTAVCSLIAKEAAIAKRHAEELSAELTTANVQLRAHAAQAEELATTRERNRVAREIHDGVGHYLTVIKVQLDAAAALLPADAHRAADSVAKAARLTGEALDDVRRSVGSLAAEAGRPPLVETLRRLAAEGAPVPALHVEGTPRSLPAAAEHALYRTAQEGLTNVRRHAGASAASLTLDFRDPARVRLVLIDNGRGISSGSKAALNNHGHGLRGLHERIALLGGTLTGANRSEGGFALTAEVPA